MSRWFRLYDDVVNDPKILKLSENLRWHWIAVLAAASKNNGIVPEISDLALILRTTDSKADKIVSLLIAAELLDVTSENGIVPHNWSGRQYQSDSSAERTRRYRQRHRDDDVTSHERFSDGTEQIQIQIQSQNRKKERANALSPPWSESDWERFWQLFPNKVGRQAARKAFEKATAKVAPAVMLSALESYANKRDDRPWCNPATWINQERWADEPAIVVPLKKRPFV